MATTNLSTDLYQINDFVNTVKQNFTEDVSEDTLLLGTFGYLGEMFSKSIQNACIMASEYCNESIPTRAKYEKNIIAHALGLGITDINAVPAQMEVLLTIVEQDLINQMTNDTFIFDKESQIFFGDYEFHPDYDIRISRVRLSNGKYTYTARYIIDIDNPVSDITNPYLTPPAKMNVQGVDVIYTKVLLRQVEKTTQYTKVLATNVIESKTFNFEFGSQLAAFTVDVTEGGTTTHLVPVYEGLSVEATKYPYIYYTYLDSNTIRCKFDRTYSYAPRINADIQINLQTSQGEGGNFTWNEEYYPQFVFDSEKYGYTNLACEIRPITGESMYGSNKKTIEELKRIIPKEALARDSITCLTDLENFFNQIDSDTSKAYLFKKRDNCLERLYYTYLLMKNSTEIIIPTNTIDIRIDPGVLLQSEDNDSLKLTLKKGHKIKYSKGSLGTLVADGEGTEEDDETTYTGEEFLYTIPYDITINSDPIYTLYRLSTMNQTRSLDFSFINENARYQFIATSITWNRPYVEDDGTYTLRIEAEQNVIDNDSNMLIRDDQGQIIGSNVHCYMVLYDSDTGNAHRWCEATFVGYEESVGIFYFEFTFKTNDVVDTTNRIRIEGDGLYDIGTNTESYAHFHANTAVEIHFVSPQDGDYGLNGLDQLIPIVGGYSLSNSYKPVNGIDFFYNFSEIINSTAIYTKEVDEDGSIIEDSDPFYIIRSVPVVKHDYFSTEDKAEDFFNELIQRKTYIDYALEVIEDNFGIDFKFFNTYGPSEVFTLDNVAEYINRVNVTFTFRLKLKANYDENIVDYIIQDIKEYIEDIQEIADLHIPNLITEITNTYEEDIVFFEFVDMNGYGPGVQHIYNMQKIDDQATKVPEFINVNTLEVLENNVLVYRPDINIILV